MRQKSHARLGEQDKTIDYLRKVQKPEWGELHQLGLMLSGKHRFAESATELRRASVLNPSNVNVVQTLFQVQELVLSAEPGFHSPALKELARVQQLLFQLDPKEAPEWEQMIHDWAPNRTHEKTGSCETRFGQSAELDTDKVFGKIPVLDPDVPECDRVHFEEASSELEKHLQQNRPLLITGAATTDWQAKSWSEAYLREKVGARNVLVVFPQDGGHTNTFKHAKKYSRAHPESWKTLDEKYKTDAMRDTSQPLLIRPSKDVMYMKDFLSLLFRGNVSVYLKEIPMHTHLPELVNDVLPPRWTPKDLTQNGRATTMWMSPGGTITSLHYDSSENVMCSLQGKKFVRLFRPEEKSKLGYMNMVDLTPKSRNRTGFSRANMDNMHPAPPSRKKTPGYKDARGLTCSIQEGECMYLPAWWHHTVLSPPSDGDGCLNVAVSYWFQQRVTQKGAMQKDHSVRAHRRSEL